MLSEKKRKKKSRLYTGLPRCVLSYRQGGVAQVVLSRQSGLLCGHAHSKLWKAISNQCKHRQQVLRAVIQIGWYCTDDGVRQTGLVCLVDMHTASFGKQSEACRYCMLSCRHGDAVQVVPSYRLGGVLGRHADGEHWKAISNQCKSWQQDSGRHQAVELA